jgi:hypothetical protein
MFEVAGSASQGEGELSAGGVGGLKRQRSTIFMTCIPCTHLSTTPPHPPLQRPRYVSTEAQKEGLALLEMESIGYDGFKLGEDGIEKSVCDDLCVITTPPPPRHGPDSPPPPPSFATTLPTLHSPFRSPPLHERR